LGAGWLAVAGVLLAAGLVTRQAPLLLLAVLLFLLLVSTRLWARYALRRVNCSRRLSSSRVFAGEDVRLEYRVSNHKLLPLPWLEIREEMDAGLVLPPGEAAISALPGKVAFRALLSVGWYQRVTRTYRVRCPQRGIYALGPVTLRTGDYFGFWSGGKTLEEPATLLVYPQLLEPEALGLPSRALFGSRSRERHLFEDPARVMGTREYASGDSLRRINWKAASRHQKLLSKVYEHTWAVTTAIFLDVRTVEPPYWSYLPELLETAVMAAAALAGRAVKERNPVGLYVNQAYHFSRELMKLPPSSNPDQLAAILEALAQVAPLEATPIEALLAREAPGLAWPSSILVITAAPLDGLLAGLQNLKTRGRTVALVIVGDARPEIKNGPLPVYRIPARVEPGSADGLKGALKIDIVRKVSHA
jgi:uncharacterized protein (DUF58 family)